MACGSGSLPRTQAVSTAIAKAPATVESLTVELGEARRRLSEMTRQLDRARRDLGQARESNLRLRHMMVAALNSTKHLRKEAVKHAVKGLLAQREELRGRIAALEHDVRWRETVGDDRGDEIDRLTLERAELRGDVMALWQRLGDVLSVVDTKGFHFPADQRKIRNARAVHALLEEKSCGSRK